MKLIFASVVFVIATFLNRLNAQIFLIDLNDSGFIYNENPLRSNNKVCYILNCLSKNYVKYGSFSLKPLILFKVFDHTGYEKIASKPLNTINLKDYLKNTILPKLSLDMSLKGKRFEFSNSDPNYHTLDSLIVYDGKSYRSIKGGVSVTEFFNVYAYSQLNPLQTSQSTFNIKAPPVKIYSWTPDSLPIPNVEELLGGRIFLFKKKNKEYTFFRHPFDCSDCPFEFYNEYVYRKDYGVIAFRSKYLYFNPEVLTLELAGRIIESDKYYSFK